MVQIISDENRNQTPRFIRRTLMVAQKEAHKEGASLRNSFASGLKTITLGR